MPWAMLARKSIGAFLVPWSIGCAGLASGAGALARTASPTPAPTARLLVFGGNGHKTFLGCLSCSRYDAHSMLNAYGDFGSRYSATSIFNRYGEFGSAYSSTSACNRYATDPPVIVDDAGTFYGRLTVNRYAAEGTPRDLLAWIAAVCS